MATLLFRLCGPMQSWGTRSRFTERDTELEPSKSGVLGLVCAALGRPRSDSIDDLAALRLGVRVDHEGVMARDYHTAGAGLGIIRASGGISRDAVLSNRYYLADADFLVGLEGGDRALLDTIDGALRTPVWQISLGRKAFVPSVPVALPGSGIRDLPLPDALRQEPWPLPLAPWAHAFRENSRSIRFVIESTFETPGHETRMDQPRGAAFRDRLFGPRPIVQQFHLMERTDVPQPAPA
ncbi:MAG TPA: type I-E CRISPR-associated protein Cas5/CasD [Tepidiformaceae bacterium]|nr:type I-E CRISPR-associated protein Cas5/CasD [Tepidiformaceae bacterium]